MTTNDKDGGDKPRVMFTTALGKTVLGKAEDVLQSRPYADDLDKKVDLIFTSPPFPLNTKKKYGNEQGEAYIDWLAAFAPRFKKLLKPKGSIVLELGNAWEPGRPVMSTLGLKALLAFLERGGLTLCQQFVWYNPARLPGPAQWVTVERIRVKDAYTHLWWVAQTDRPQADNRQVLTKYSAAMEKLLERQKYNTGKRPSEHHISKESFLKKNEGAIPSNMITLANTHASSDYLKYCRLHKLQPHPARMPAGLAEFFIKFLTKPKMLVLDPFSGSNTTGAVAETLGRRWMSIEPNDLMCWVLVAVLTALSMMTEQGAPPWSLQIEPRAWQRGALEKWLVRMRGVVSVVTGGGKTVFAFLCIEEFLKRYPGGRIIVLVPTITLLDQWYVGLREELGVPMGDIACFSSQEKVTKPRTINVLVINTGREQVRKLANVDKAFLIVDECHRAGSPENARALAGEFAAALGLSATPQREYDRGFEDHVVPILGPVIFEYDYAQAYHDKVVAPFDLINVQVEMIPDEQAEYDKLTKRAAVLLRKMKSGETMDEQLKRVLQMRASVSATARMRLPVAAKIVEENRGARTIVFHERVASAKTLFEILQKRKHSVCLYHSKIAPEVRRDNLRLFRRGVFDVLISCRALDEGMNVPETTVAVIASSTASQRQRIQRLGRVLRPAKGKDKAIIYTLYATAQERTRLEKEAARLEGVAEVVWSVSQRQAQG